MSGEHISEPRQFVPCFVVYISGARHKTPWSFEQRTQGVGHPFYELEEEEMFHFNRKNAVG